MGISETVESSGKRLDSLLLKLNSDEGALSYFTSEEVLVKDIDTVMQNIKESTARFNENMEALKHNFLFRGYFKKQERKLKREAKQSKKQGN